MNKELFKAMAKQLWAYIFSYFVHYLYPSIKESLIKTYEYFIDCLWDSLKGKFTENIEVAVEYIEKFFNSPAYEEKEKEVMDVLFQNVDLPFVLKPFKPLLKKLLSNKIRALIGKYLKKLNTKA